jgi:hypothetical protein
MLVARPPRRNADSRRRRSGHRALRRGPANPACGTRAPSTPCLGARRRARQGLSPSPDSPGSLRSRGAGATPLPVTPASRLARGTGAVDVRLWLGDSLYGLPTIRTPLRPDADVDRVRQDCSPVCPGALAEHAVQDLPESHSLILSEVRDQHAPGQSLHGKEGVDGSSPSEGFAKGQQMALFCASASADRRRRLPPTCPQDLSPALRRLFVLGLNGSLLQGGVPPCRRGAPRSGSSPPRAPTPRRPGREQALHRRNRTSPG